MEKIIYPSGIKIYFIKKKKKENKITLMNNKKYLKNTHLLG